MRVLGLALAATVVSSLPPFLVGGMAVEVERDLGITLGQIGATVSAYFAASALCSAAMGRLSHRLGPPRAMALAAGVSAISMAGVFLTARSFASLVPWLALAGSANSLAQPSVNSYLAGGVGRGRLGLALGVKQSGIPVASLLSGLAVPALVLTVGWRGAFAAGTGLAVCCALALLRGDPRLDPTPPEREGAPDLPHRTLAALGAAAGLGSVAGNCLGAFTVSSATAIGVGQAEAGIALAGGGLVCVLVRLSAGWWEDRGSGDGLGPIPPMLLVGTLGFAGLASGQPALLIVSVVLAFGGGWGWPGLFQLSIVSLNPSAPAIATGLTQTGTYLGAAIGPLLFGIVAGYSYAVAWSMVVLALLLASAIIVRCRPRDLPNASGPGRPYR